MKGSPVTKAIALFLLSGIAFLCYLGFKLILPTLWAIGAAIATPFVFVYVLGVISEGMNKK